MKKENNNFELYKAEFESRASLEIFAITGIEPFVRINSNEIYARTECFCFILPIKKQNIEIGFNPLIHHCFFDKENENKVYVDSESIYKDIKVLNIFINRKERIKNILLKAVRKYKRKISKIKYAKTRKMEL